MDSPLHIYQTPHKWSRMICGAFAIGSGGKIVSPAPLLPGSAFFYGCLRGSLPSILQCQREGREYFYADNAYFCPGKSESSYFRITKCALQHTGAGELPFPKHLARERFAKLGINIKPWRKSGNHVLVCPPSRLFGATWGFNADEWLRLTLKTLRKYTDRELRVRAKMSWNDVKPNMAMDIMGAPEASVRGSLDYDLAGAWAVVTRSSNTAVEALIAGVPVFCTASCGASAMALSDLTQIESPILPDGRERWAAILASNQWTLSEMRSGLAWRMLNEIS